MEFDEKREGLEEEIEKCKSGKCPYRPNILTSEQNCSPTRFCDSGVDKYGEVYCDQLKRELDYLVYPDKKS